MMRPQVRGGTDRLSCFNAVNPGYSPRSRFSSCFLRIRLRVGRSTPGLLLLAPRFVSETRDPFLDKDKPHLFSARPGSPFAGRGARQARYGRKRPGPARLQGVTLSRQHVNPFAWTGDPPRSPNRSRSEPPPRPAIAALELIGIPARVEHDLVHLEPGNMHPFDGPNQAFCFLLVHWHVSSLRCPLICRRIRCQTARQDRQQMSHSPHGAVAARSRVSHGIPSPKAEGERQRKAPQHSSPYDRQLQPQQEIWVRDAIEAFQHQISAASVCPETGHESFLPKRREKGHTRLVAARKSTIASTLPAHRCPARRTARGDPR